MIRPLFCVAQSQAHPKDSLNRCKSLGAPGAHVSDKLHHRGNLSEYAGR
jgi:hypothetical protein